MTQDTLLNKARQLIQLGVIVAAPVPALADDIEITPPPPVSTAALQADYSAVGTYSNSGFFTGELDETKASGSTLGMGFKLSGEAEFADSELYSRRYASCYDGACDPYSLYYSRGDTTGVAFVWGGKVTGNLVDGDQLKAAYEFSIDWRHTALPTGYDYASVNWTLHMGFANMAYTDGVTPQALRGNARGYTEVSGYLGTEETGLHTFAGELSAYHQAYSWEENPDWYWYVLLEAHLSEAGERWTSPGDPAPASMNGDFLRVVVPGNSIDVGINAVPVPEAQSWAMALAGLGVAGLLAGRRRRKQG